MIRRPLIREKREFSPGSTGTVAPALSCVHVYVLGGKESAIQSMCTQSWWTLSELNIVSSGCSTKDGPLGTVSGSGLSTPKSEELT